MPWQDIEEVHMGDLVKAVYFNKLRNNLYWLKDNMPSLIVKSITVSDATNQVDLDNLDINTDKLYMLAINVKNDDQVDDTQYRIAINNILSANQYYRQRHLVAGVTHQVARNRDNTINYLTYIGFSSDIFASIALSITGHLIAQGRSCDNYGDTISMYDFALSSIFTTNNITKIIIQSDAEYGIGVGSRILLLKPV